jgi:hypothetical protein
MTRRSVQVASWLALLPIAAIPDAAFASVEVGCEIRATRNQDGTRLAAIISASGPVSGTYSFRVDRRGAGAPIAEQGVFEIEEAAPSEVKKVELSLPAGKGYDASLTIQWPNGSSSCSASL